MCLMSSLILHLMVHAWMDYWTGLQGTDPGDHSELHLQNDTKLCQRDVLPCTIQKHQHVRGYFRFEGTLVGQFSSSSCRHCQTTGVHMIAWCHSRCWLTLPPLTLTSPPPLPLYAAQSAVHDLCPGILIWNEGFSNHWAVSAANMVMSLAFWMLVLSTILKVLVQTLCQM